MSGYKFKKKPTMNEVANTILELNNRVNSLMGLLSELEKVFSLYVEMKGDNKELTEFIDKKIKEWRKNQNESVPNEKANTEHISRDKQDKKTRSKRVRKKVK